jgi:hypothetical protein
MQVDEWDSTTLDLSLRRFEIGSGKQPYSNSGHIPSSLNLLFPHPFSMMFEKLTTVAVGKP